MVDGRTIPPAPGGTVHLSAADGWGNLAALTLTHGGAFGARVTVPGLGLTLGHGMSKFDPHRDHPNCPGPHKRPLNNMCPTIVSREGVPLLALGGAGGRRIPSALVQVLATFASGLDVVEAIAELRLHAEGDDVVLHEPEWPGGAVHNLGRMGYETTAGTVALMSGVALDAAGARCVPHSR